MRPSVQQHKLDQNWVMQQDNDPKHTSKSTPEWVKKIMYRNSLDKVQMLIP